MTNLPAVNPAEASGKTKDMLDQVQKQLGVTPNMMRTMAVSPVVLEGYLGLLGALGWGTLSGKLRQQLALVVAQMNECGYCLAAHTLFGKRAGLTDEELMGTRRVVLEDTQALAAIRFASSIVEKRGRVDEADIAAVRLAGFGDAEIAEIVAHVALSTFTNYFNSVAGTALDFPAVELDLTAA